MFPGLPAPPDDRQSYIATLLSGLKGYLGGMGGQPAPTSSSASVPQGQYSSVYDDAVKAIQTGDPSVAFNDPTTVFSRFTKTPMTILGHNPYTRKMSANKSVGLYHPDRKNAEVILPPQNPTWADLQGTIHHEDTHAALDQAGKSMADFADNLFTQRTDPSAIGMGPHPITFMLDAFDDSRRMGNAYSELPAYMTAYKPGEIQGITPEMAADWLQRYISSLPSNAGKTVSRISESNKAAQRVK